MQKKIAFWFLQNEIMPFIWLTNSWLKMNKRRLNCMVLLFIQDSESFGFLSKTCSCIYNYIVHTNNISLLLKSNKTREYINPEIWFICSRFVKTAYIDLFAPLYRVMSSKLYIYRWWLSLARIGAHVTSTSMSSKWLCKNNFLVSLQTRLLVDLENVT